MSSNVRGWAGRATRSCGAVSSRSEVVMKVIVAALALLVVAVATAHTQSQPFGRPRAGLTPVEFEEFRLGPEDFLEVEAADEGLGPAFNGTSRAVCHHVHAIRGAGPS